MNFEQLRAAAPIALLLAGCTARGLGDSVTSPVKPDETVTFYTSAAWPAAESGAWQADVRGIIFENEKRPLLAAALRKMLGLHRDELPPAERTLLDQRVDLFMADNERGKAIPALLAGLPCELPPSAPNGHFSATLTFPGKPPGPVTISAVLPDNDPRAFSGLLLLIPDNDKPLIVSDVDDTIKITEVRDRRAAIRHTFCQPFAPVPGMAEKYRQWAAAGAAFQYVSGSPWQLYTPLETFVRENNFPPGAWHLKHLRLADPSTLLAFLGPQEEHKLSAIRPFLQHWKQRPLVLIGDTGEQDPEIYARLARENPARIARIFLHNITGETRDNPRLTAACKDIPAEKWTLFDKAEALPAKLSP